MYIEVLENFLPEFLLAEKEKKKFIRNFFVETFRNRKKG